MQYIELTVYVVLPEPAAFHSVVERQATVIFKGHPRVVVPLANMLQGAVQVLGGKGLEGGSEGQEESIAAPESTSQPTEGVEEEVDGIPS